MKKKYERLSIKLFKYFDVGHRAHSVFAGFHVPTQKRHRRHHRRSQKHKNDIFDECERSGKCTKFVGKLTIVINGSLILN